MFGTFGLQAACLQCQQLGVWGAPCKGWELAALSIRFMALCLHGNQQQEHPLVQSSWRGGEERGWLPPSLRP